MNLVFMGTPDFAVAALERLASCHNVMAVFTQPDKPKNRGKKMQAPPVKECAEKLGIPVYQPLSLRKGDDAETSLEVLNKLSPDCIVVAAYGQILPESILSLPKYSCINIHASLLPKYRGAAPIQKCIIDGETKSGVTTMLMEKGLDTGDMLLKKEVEIGENETAGELTERLAQVGAELLAETIRRYAAGEIAPVKQNEAEMTYEPLLTKELGRIDWMQDARTIANLVRGVNPWPGA